MKNAMKLDSSASPFNIFRLIDMINEVDVLKKDIDIY